MEKKFEVKHTNEGIYKPLDFALVELLFSSSSVECSESEHDVFILTLEFEIKLWFTFIFRLSCFKTGVWMLTITGPEKIFCSKVNCRLIFF